MSLKRRAATWPMFCAKRQKAEVECGMFERPGLRRSMSSDPMNQSSRTSGAEDSPEQSKTQTTSADPLAQEHGQDRNGQPQSAAPASTDGRIDPDRLPKAYVVKHASLLLDEEGSKARTDENFVQSNSARLIRVKDGDREHFALVLTDDLSLNLQDTLSSFHEVVAQTTHISREQVHLSKLRSRVLAQLQVIERNQPKLVASSANAAEVDAVSNDRSSLLDALVKIDQYPNGTATELAHREALHAERAKSAMTALFHALSREGYLSPWSADNDTVPVPLDPSTLDRLEGRETPQDQVDEANADIPLDGEVEKNGEREITTKIAPGDEDNIFHQMEKAWARLESYKQIMLNKVDSSPNSKTSSMTSSYVWKLSELNVPTEPRRATWSTRWLRCLT